VLGGDDSSQETAEADQKSDSSQSSTSDLGTSTSSDQAVDALGAVEEIVGEVGANETLTQQIESFKLKAQQMADTGKAQGDRMMIKYGIYVVNQVKKVQEDIANGDSEELCIFYEKIAEDDEFLKAVALGTDYEEMRIKILTAMAEDRLKQLEKDYKNGYILND